MRPCKPAATENAMHLAIWTILLALLAAVVPARQAAAEDDVWRFAIEEIDGSVQDAYAREFKKRIEERSDGAVRVEIYPYGSLGTSDDLTELTAMGAIQFSNASPGHLGKLVPQIQVLSIPYLLSENDEVNKDVLRNSRVLYGAVGAELEERGLKLLTIYPEGKMVWTTNRPVRDPEDFDNFKMRTMNSPMLIAAYRAFGASPTPLPYAEVYGGLQLKIIDGQVNPVFAIEEMKFYEVSDYMIWAGQQTFTTTVITNSDWYKDLPREQRRWIDDTVNEMVDVIFDVAREYNYERLEIIRKNAPELEFIHLTPEERAAFKERAKRLHQTFIRMAGPKGADILDRLQREIRETEERLRAEPSG